MNIFRKIVGAKSKYDKSIPYLYEARLPIDQLPGEYHSYLAETICSLLRRLKADGVGSDEVTLHEIFQGREKQLLVEHCVDGEGRWLDKPDLCRSLEKHYSGHIADDCCSFEDRKQQGEGPF